jgi:hypothetical protein
MVDRCRGAAPTDVTRPFGRQVQRKIPTGALPLAIVKPGRSAICSASCDDAGYSVKNIKG